MQPEIRANPSSDRSLHRVTGAVAPPSMARERRDLADRRRRMYWSVVYGGFRPRRRTLPRRRADSRFHTLDWHAAPLLAVALGIVLLSVADAFLTVILLSNGADEINPIMAALVYRSVTVFTALKIGMTAASVIFMVLLANYRFMRVVRVEALMYSVLAAYCGLIGYELWMLKARVAALFF
jgi:hypothetical protein